MQTVAVDTLRGWLERGDPVTVVDVRPAAEREEWHIPGSLHLDVYGPLQARDPQALAGVDLPCGRPVVTVCGAGRTSLVAAEQLRARGLQAFSLEGGMRAWSLAWNWAEVPLPGSRARLLQVRRTGKGCLSYLIGAGPTAAVIDPALPPQVYLDLARAHGWRIRHVLETHIHADHLSRARQLSACTGAALLLPAQDRVRFPFSPLADGEALCLDAGELTVLRTPGHTLESTCYLMDGRALCTGDTLFLDAVGRPDLGAGPEEARSRARLLHRSLRRLLALPDETLILPGHTGEPVAFDRRPLCAPLAAVRARVQLADATEEAFVGALLERLPPTPPNYQRIVELNEAGDIPDADPAQLEAGANRCAVH